MWIQHLLHLVNPRVLGETVDVPNDANRLLWAIWSFTVASAVFLGLRIYCKLSRVRSLWWDDHFLVASWIAIMVSTAMLTEGTKVGIGLHYQDMKPKDMPKMAWISYGAGFCATLATIWSKTSFGITLLRLSTGWVKWLVWFVIISTNLVHGFAAAMMWIQCWPVAKLWTPDLEGTCWPNSLVQNYQTFANAYSGVLDLILTILPWKIIWGVAINKKEKLGALIAMSCGVFSGIMSFLKIISLKEIGDVDSTNVNVKIFGTAEPAVTVIAVSIPVLRAFIRKDAASKLRSIRFIQFSHITEPSGGRSALSFEKTYAGDSDMGLVSQTSMPSQVSAARRDVKV